MIETTTPQRAAGTRDRALPRSIAITVPLPDPLLSINYRKRMHWRTQARHTAAQREAAMLAAYAAMSGEIGTLFGPVFPVGKVRADVAIYRRPRQQVLDEGGAWEAMKPVWDGFESARVVGNDKQITHGEMVWHPTDPDPRIVVTLTEVWV